MSYSFTVTGATKVLAIEAVTKEFDNVTATQPTHAKDRDAVVTNAAAAINLLADDEDQDVSAECSGFLSWTGVPGEERIGSVNIRVNAQLVARSPAA